MQRHNYAHDVIAQDPDTAGLLAVRSADDASPRPDPLRLVVDQGVEEEIAADLAAEQADANARIALVAKMQGALAEMVEAAWFAVAKVYSQTDALTSTDRYLLNLHRPGILRDQESRLADVCAKFLQNYYRRHGITFRPHLESGGRIFENPAVSVADDGR
jgi:hypothetical protein